MDLPIMSAVAVGLALVSLSPERGAEIKAEGAAALVGERLYASETHIDRWGEPVRAEDLALEDLGRVAAVVDGADGAPGHLVVEVGGLWGLGARQVEVGTERLHLLSATGGDRLVVDLSADGAAPVSG